ncbi:MAG: N-acyl homoserine lactonase family protein [Chitinophagales bacterium]|nr:N-acyl homoserine lactonase family protein [Chitinophagales bacterium]
MSNIKIHVLHCGKMRLDVTFLGIEKSRNPLAYAGLFRSAKHQIWLPLSAYLIEHHKGLVLIDTGWHKAVRTQRTQHLGWLYSTFATLELPPNHAIDEQLSARGLRPADIDHVVLSHLHLDHVSGVEQVREAKNIWVSDLELQDTQTHPFYYRPTLWADVPLKTFSFHVSQYGAEKLAFDLFEDDSLVLVNTPGHTRGLVTALIQNNDKCVVLCSDVAYSKAGIEQQVLPVLRVDNAQAKRSLEWVKQISEQKNCIAVLPNHDPAILPHTIIL